MGKPFDWATYLPPENEPHEPDKPPPEVVGFWIVFGIAVISSFFYYWMRW